MPVRHRGEKPQPATGAAIAARHIGGGPGFVEEHQVVGIERRQAPDEDPPRLGYGGAILLGSVQALFLSVILWAVRKRHRLDSPTVIPDAVASAPRISCKVRSGCLATNSNTTVRCSTRRER